MICDHASLGCSLLARTAGSLQLTWAHRYRHAVYRRNKVHDKWRYLYRALDSNGDTAEFWFSQRRNLTATKRLLRRTFKRHGRPKRIVIDSIQTNREAILSCDTAARLRERSRCCRKPIRSRQSAYLVGPE
ncbi:hypothetical protein DC522_31945 [Microvirga sp. KLBC 81]|nr:hypothetical protein DC522_31945 [Microvirga sp. KLBC 81]